MLSVRKTEIPSPQFPTMPRFHNIIINPVIIFLFLLLHITEAFNSTTTSDGAGIIHDVSYSYYDDDIDDTGRGSHVEEFLMDSESGTRRFLASQRGPGSGVSLKRDKSFCNRNVYGNCPGPVNDRYKKRKCSYANHCGDKGG